MNTGAPGEDRSGANFSELGDFSDLVDFAGGARVGPGRGQPLTSSEVRRALGFDVDGAAQDPTIERSWSRDGVDGQVVSWSVGYGPRTQAWLLRPSGSTAALPGILALHDHSNFKLFGKEKIADGPDAGHHLVSRLRELEYEGRAFANELCRRGFVVLVPDVFLWGSRRFDLESAHSPSGNDWVDPGVPAPPQDRSSDAWVRWYNGSAIRHEHLVAKYCQMLGTSLAGVVAYEDRVALSYLKQRSDVVNGTYGCIGLSGGGARAALLQATSPDISAAVVVGMMSTYDELLERHIAPHTWMFFPPGLDRDWSQLAASRAPSPLLVQYARHDPLFPIAGMVAADQQIRARYYAAGSPDNYVSQFFDGGHRFDLAMQEEAFAQLSLWLA